ncbi:hypothetical protein UFOVP184_5 [uncultured Caudovirales phage]|uniref:Uncharacterized protein n=1 Tax=uncultured Caudovirales phage TaxID=2100421 RepID=A0A6J7WC51_9CAUD|nr:hypothetical protein UFOVP184_5 [uncultured Caudovirales phage]
MQQYIRITKEKDKLAGDATTGYNSGPMDSPVLNSDYIWLEIGTQAPAINQQYTTWTVQSVVPKRGVTNRTTGADQYRITGQFQTHLFHEQAVFWKKAVLEPSYDPTTLVQDLPSYCIDRVIIGYEGLKWTDRITGCKFSQATLASSSGAQAPVSLNVSFTGSKRDKIPDTTAADIPNLTHPNCTDLPTKVYRWSKSTILLNPDATAVADQLSLDKVIRSWTVEINHTLSERINKGAYITALAHHGWNPSLSAVWDIDDWVLKQRYLDIYKGQESVKFAKSTLVLADANSTGNTTFTWKNLVLENLQDSFPITEFMSGSGKFKPHFDCSELDLQVSYLAGTAVTPP